MKRWLIWGLYGAFFGFIAYIFGAMWNLEFLGFSQSLFIPSCPTNSFCLGSSFLHGALYFIVNVGLGFLIGILVYKYFEKNIGKK